MRAFKFGGNLKGENKMGTNNISEEEAKKYILRYGWQPVVVKGSGKIFDTKKDDRPLNYFLDDIAKCHQEKLRVAIVHGGGTEINDVLKANGLPIQFAEDGSRITDMKTLPYVIESMAEVNQSIVEGLQSRGVNAEPVRGTDVFSVEAKDFDNLGYVGKLTGFNSTLSSKFRFNALKPEVAFFDKASIVPVVNPVSSDKYGRVFNINADDAATELAVARAARLIMLSDTPVRNNGVVIPEIDVVGMELQKLIETGVIKDGMLKKIMACADAIERGMKPMSVIDGTKKDSLWNELTTDSGSGTLIYKGPEKGEY